VHWSVSAQAAGDRELRREEIVELADAVAAAGGVASGIGQTAYGAQLLVEAPSREEAIEKGSAIFLAAAARAGLPSWPITAVSAMNQDEDDEVGLPRSGSAHSRATRSRGRGSSPAGRSRPCRRCTS
jgi:hypothetical protein